MLTLEWKSADGAVCTQKLLVGTLALGPAQGLPEGAGTLQITASRVVLLAGPGWSVSAYPVAPAARRLWRSGEAATFAGQTLTVRGDAGPPPSTAMLARELLKGGPLPPELLELGPSLLWLNGPDLGRRLSLQDEATFIGRGEGCAARLQDARASRLHAKVVKTAGGFQLVDLLGANGMKVNGQPVSGTRLLRPGDLLCVGETLLSFESPLDALPPEPEPKPAEPPKPAEAPPPEKPVRAVRRPAARLSALEWAMLGLGALALVGGGGALWWGLR